jgi:hypothetical protein
LTNINNKKIFNTQDFCAIAMVLLTVAIVYLTDILKDVAKEQTIDNKNQILESEKSRQTDYALRFDEKIFSGKNLEVVTAIQGKKPILKINGGRIEDYELDLYLGVLNQLEGVREMGLISDELTYDNFCDDVSDTSKNKEVQDYLSKIRKEDSTYFAGFTQLAKFCSTY